MTHTYSQSTGDWTTPEGVVFRGYSGHGDGYNNPALQEAHNVGPVPRGDWIIGAEYHHDILGPITMNLTWAPGPEGDTIPGDRFAFRVHGNLPPPNDREASDGCIIQDHTARVAISAHADRRLRVVG